MLHSCPLRELWECRFVAGLGHLVAAYINNDLTAKNDPSRTFSVHASVGPIAESSFVTRVSYGVLSWCLKSIQTSIARHAT